MKIIYPLLTVLLGCFFSLFFTSLPGQQFLNSDLNGTVTTSGNPTSWSQIPYTDINSNASGVPQATSDVTSLTGPSAGAGINGNPYSGSTFVCGLMMNQYGSYWHEGLMQTVSGFTPGQVYNIRFWQTVVKQSNALDQSGGWLVVRDNTPIMTTSASFSVLPYNSNSLQWNMRDVSFVATAPTHTFKFLPMDDDPLVNSNTQGIRMGIDQISLTTTVVLAWEADLQLSQGKESTVDLGWEMPEAHHAAAFHVERSADGTDFEYVNTVDGGYAGSFTSTDHFPYNDLTYYRLAQVGMDGSIRYSKVKSIQLALPMDAFIAGRTLKIRGAQPGPCDAKLYDLSGRLIYHKTDVESEAYLAGISSGIYVLHVTQGQEMVKKKVAIE